MENGSSLVSPTQTSSRGNVLSSKLTSVLSRSYVDPEIRESLAILDEKNTVNDVKFRRRLWLDAQKEVIECNGAIVEDFGVVAEQLRRVGKLIGDLNQTCEAMKGQISTAHKGASPTIREASSLMVQKREVESKQKLLEAFGQHFIINDEDLNLLTSSAEPVNERYFQILNRVKQIRKDCEVLLGSEDQTLGLELMEQTSRNLNAAFEKLYSWIQREFKALDLDDPHISGSIRKALRVLAERPSMFENCLNFFAEARERILLDGFHAALNNPSDPNVASSAKPINLQTHDILRYTGDMLAWIHSAVVSEREALGGLFMNDGPFLAQELEAGKAGDLFSLAKKSSSSPSSPSEDFDATKALAALVTRSLSGAGRLLKSKIDIAIATADDPLLIFKARSLLQFYTGIFRRWLGSDSSLVEAFIDMQTQATSHFERLLQDEVSTATAETTVSDQLDIPAVLTAALERVVLLLRDNLNINDQGIEQLLSTALVPFLEVCEKAASSETDLDDTEKGVFRLNYLLAVTTTLTPLLPSEHGFLGVADGKVKSTKSALVAAQHAFLLRESGIQALLSADQQPTESDSEKSPDQAPTPFNLGLLATAAAQLDAFLPSALMDVLENLTRLTDRTVAKEIAAEAAESFCVDFEKVEERVAAMDAERAQSEDERDEEGEEGKERAGEVFPRTTAEIRVLLS